MRQFLTFWSEKTWSCIVSDKEWASNPDPGIQKLLGQTTIFDPGLTSKVAQPKKLPERPKFRTRTKLRTCCRCGSVFPKGVYAFEHGLCADCHRRQVEARLAEIARARAEKKARAKALRDAERERQEAERARAREERAKREQEARERAKAERLTKEEARKNKVRKCSRCGVTLTPDNHKYYDGSYCYECHKEVNRAHRLRTYVPKGPHWAPDIDGMRVCNKCGKSLPVEDFPLAGTQRFPGSRRRTCKTCYYKFRYQARITKQKQP